MSARDAYGIGRRDLAVFGTCGLALFVALSLVFYAQITWLYVFVAFGLFDFEWIPWVAVLVIVPAGTVAILPGVVAHLITEKYSAWAVWLAAAGIIGVVLGLHDLWYGPIYLL